LLSRSEVQSRIAAWLEAESPSAWPVSIVLLEFAELRGILRTHGVQAGARAFEFVVEALRLLISDLDAACRWSDWAILVARPGAPRRATLRWVVRVRRAIDDLHLSCGGAPLPLRLRARVLVAHGGMGDGPAGVAGDT
jgi:GGDEF domain-containing protein